MARWLRDNGLSIVLFSLFVLFLVGQGVSGWLADNETRARRGLSSLALSSYVKSGEFVEATAENWESEFLQMAAFVLLSAVLVQRGSAESKRPERDEPKPTVANRLASMRLGYRGGFLHTVYGHSLSLALAILFLVSFVAHALGGTVAYNEDALAHGEATLSAWQFVRTPTFWFQSFQNWQSEFLSVGVLVVLTIFLRERGSPQSKPVEAPNAQTGSH